MSPDLYFTSFSFPKHNIVAVRNIYYTGRIMEQIDDNLYARMTTLVFIS